MSRQWSQDLLGRLFLCFWGCGNSTLDKGPFPVCSNTVNLPEEPGVLGMEGVGMVTRVNIVCTSAVGLEKRVSA